MTRVCISFKLVNIFGIITRPRGYKESLWSAQLRIKFQMLIGIKISRKCSDKHRMLFFLLINCWHFNIYEQEKFHAQLS